MQESDQSSDEGHSPSLPCFKAYDIRGRVPDELNEALAYRIGRAYGHLFSPKSMVVGRDVRLSSPALAEAVSSGLADSGVDVLDLGLCGTEEVYFAAFSMEASGVDGGIMVTASHNPVEYNGMKLVRRGARPLTGPGGLFDLEREVAMGDRQQWFASHTGGREPLDMRRAYIAHLLSFIDRGALTPLKVVVNSGNGCAGPVVDLLEQHLPFTFIKIHHEPDGTFPNGVPNPLLPEKREATARAVVANGADMGIAWDGDFDRCFFFDETGRFLEGYYIVGLLAAAVLAREPGAVIVHDPRLVWNTQEIVRAAGGIPVQSRTGHAFLKEVMREQDAAYGGEMSAHHYFRDFGYCDTGMAPWLLVAAMVAGERRPLSDMVAERMAAFPVSGEINSTVDDPDAVIARIAEEYHDGEQQRLDGLSVSYPDYRFNIRKSNTEPVLRLNVETRGDASLLEAETGELLRIIRRGA